MSEPKPLSQKEIRYWVRELLLAEVCEILRDYLEGNRR